MDFNTKALVRQSRFSGVLGLFIHHTTYLRQGNFNSDKCGDAFQYDWETIGRWLSFQLFNNGCVYVAGGA